jgi:cell division protein FtsL
MIRRLSIFFFTLVCLNISTHAQLRDKAYDETVGKVEYKDIEQIEESTVQLMDEETVWNFGGIGNVLLIALVVGILIFILYFIISKLSANKSNKKIDRALQFVEENLDEVDATEIEDELENAIQNKRYNQAVRYLFLRNLKFLNEKALIFWKKHKTNYTYSNELPSKFKEGFSGTAVWFDLARYSKHTVNAEEFDTVRQTMMHFYNQIQGYEQK